jgi:deoxyribodipyrimidine photolyase-related protein
MGTALILYPNQLFDIEFIPKVQRIYLVEEPLLFGTDTERPMGFHKQRLVLLRASMRRYAEEVLWPNGYDVDYIENSSDVVTDTAVVKAAFEGANEILVFDPIDDLLWSRIESASQALEVHVPLRKLENPNYYLKHKDVESYFGGKQKHKFADFYQYQRERFDILIDKDYRPVGGKWNFDSENRKKLPKDIVIPGFQSYGDNDFVREAITYVELKFPNNPGRTDTFMWPTNHAESRAWMAEFFATRLSNFGPYEDAIDSRGVWLFHSALTPMLNIGLLQPQEIIDSLLDYCATTKKVVPIESLEGFIRQVLGWREYVRGIYVTQGSTMRTKNVLGNHRKLTAAWYDGTTGIKPVDDVIHKVNDFGYAHHIERLMIVGNFMLLCDIDPDEVHKWFMSFFIDAYDWVMVPNIYGMSQYSDGGSMTTKPYMSASNYILAMSAYKKEPWCDVWDGLFWRFVDTHRIMLKKNPRLGAIMISRLDKMDPARKRIIGYRAQDFLDTMTIPPAQM